MPKGELNEKKSYREWKLRYYHFLWQIIRRHDDYRSFCDRFFFAFDKGQIPCIDPLTLDPSGRKEYGEILGRFGLDVAYHYSLEIPAEDILSWPLFKSVDAVTNKQREANPYLFTPIDGRFIELRIDITRPEAVIRDDVLWEIQWAKRQLGRKGKRFHGENAEDMFRVWDLHQAGKSSTQIIKQLWPEEHEALKGSTDVALRTKFDELNKKYKRLGMTAEEAEDRARDEAYSDDQVSGEGRLYVRVGDNLRRMKRSLASLGGKM